MGKAPSFGFFWWVLYIDQQLVYHFYKNDKKIYLSPCFQENISQCQ